MLKLHFINVAEGDAILVEDCGEQAVTRLLVDTGRADVGTSPGSLRLTCAAYLKKLGITQIDHLVLTHLHVDHAAGLTAVLDTVRIGHVYQSYFPTEGAAPITVDRTEERHVVELADDLNRYLADCGRMRDAGTVFHETLQDAAVTVSDGLTMHLRTAPRWGVLGQNAVYDAMLHGERLPEDIRYWASEARNPHSLRVELAYAGRLVRLDGDYLAEGAEREETTRCDILKVAHHGDKKSMTPGLAEAMRPEYAVICCQQAYVASKERPCRRVVEDLETHGAQVLYTDGFAWEGETPRRAESIVMTNSEAGEITLEE